jgi:predicted nucleic acid-binding protein
VTERVFLDTNVLIYADDRDAGDRRMRAREILGEAFTQHNGVISTQVLQEYFSVATRKLGIKPEATRKRVELLATMDVVRIDVSLILAAIDLVRLHSVAFWDALIIQSAQVAGCRLLLTEDLQHGQVFNSLRVENPFRDTEPPIR